MRGRNLQSERESRGQHAERKGEGWVTGDVLHRRRVDLGRQPVYFGVGSQASVGHATLGGQGGREQHPVVTE